MNKEDSQGMGRREFILMTSSTALAAIAMGQVRMPFSSASASGRSYALGFAEADAYKRVVDGRFTPNVMSADRVTSSDGAMLRDGVRVSVRGYNVEADSPTDRSSMELIANYLTSDGGKTRTLPFSAWSYTKRGGAGSPISFVVPVDFDQRLHMLFSTGASPSTPPPENGVDPNAFELSLLSGDNAPKLRPGFYMLAPLAAGVSAPDWSSLQLRETDNGFKLYAMNGFDPAPARFNYLILFLELAGKREALPRASGPKAQ